MKKSWPILLLVFAMFTALTAVQGYYGLSSLEETNSEAALIHQEYRANASAINSIQSLMLQSSVILRDIVLSSASRQDLQEALGRLAAIRTEVNLRVAALKTNLGFYRPELVEAFAKEISQYWDFLDKLDWDAMGPERAELLASLRNEITPKREVIMSMTKDVTEITKENLNRETQRIDQSIQEARNNMWSVLALVILASITATGFAVAHVRSLELTAAREHESLEEAKEELGRLNLELVNAGEVHRKSLSLELHDQVGQTLTALKFGISGLDSLGDEKDDAFHKRLAELKLLAEECIRTVRDIAMGLRPSVLDDLGLGPALEWLGREFGRQSGIKVEVLWSKEAGLIAEEGLRTNLYRIAQEALTNCARHSGASRAVIRVESSGSGIQMTIEDDGLGFVPQAARSKGLGLIGMGERVKKHGGTMELDSRLYVGTRLVIRMPLPREEKR